MLGLCFSSWASRIPYIQQKLHLTNGQFGFILLSLPTGSFVSLPFAGWLVTNYGSKRVLTVVSLSYCIILITIILATNHVLLILALFCFGCVGNMGNISVNTQAVAVENIYKRQIMASFHGVWSLAGFFGAALAILLTTLNFSPVEHFCIVGVIGLVLIIVAYKYLLTDETKTTTKTPLFVWPDSALLVLGLIAFCCMLCEGIMFDWSGIYFKKIVNPPPHLSGLGYSAFMCTMATGRFISDYFTNRYGFSTILKVSGITITTGLLIAVLFPYFYWVITGFLLIGFGVSSIVPMVYSAAGKSTNISPGKALASVSTISFLGFLVGPPFIGMVADFWGLRLAFGLMSAMGIIIILLSQMHKPKP